ncbi:MAG: fused MFS/spermidine synthase [Bacteroidia bacterium]|jgi:predicted membrane-bound spermidine synthase
MKRLLSYIIPIRLKKYQSHINGLLEVNLTNGKLTLDSTVSNYSYGSLQKVLRRGLKEMGDLSQFKNILLLGLGGGSVIKTLRNELACQAEITAVDIDSAMLKIAEVDFQIGQYAEIKLKEADAAIFITETTEKYDLIIVDIFIGDTVPDVFTKPSFIHQLITHLTAHGHVLFNTMRNSMSPETFALIQESFRQDGMNVKVLERVEVTNNVLIAKR